MDDTAAIGARVPTKLRDYIKDKPTSSLLIQQLLFEYVLKEEGKEYLDSLCEGFTPYRKWVHYKEM